MVKIEYAATAVKDLKTIHNFIAIDSSLYAKRFIGLLRQHIAILKEHPQAGRPFYPDKFNNLRQILYKSYRIIYRYHNDVVTVIAIQRQSKPLGNII